MLESVLLVGLSAAVISLLVTVESITEKYRIRVSDWLEDKSLDFFANLLNCPYCLNWWIAGILAVAFGIDPLVYLPAVAVGYIVISQRIG